MFIFCVTCHTCARNSVKWRTQSWCSHWYSLNTKRKLTGLKTREQSKQAKIQTSYKQAKSRGIEKTSNKHWETNTKKDCNEGTQVNMTNCQKMRGTHRLKYTDESRLMRDRLKKGRRGTMTGSLNHKHDTRGENYKIKSEMSQWNPEPPTELKR